jgi:hypothetical protein
MISFFPDGVDCRLELHVACGQRRAHISPCIHAAGTAGEKGEATQGSRAEAGETQRLPLFLSLQREASER